MRERLLDCRELRSVAQANTAFLALLNDVAHPRPHPTLPGVTVADCLTQEKTRLLRLPEVPLVAVDETAFIRFDTNDSSVPHEYAQQENSTFAVADDDITVRVLKGEVEVARRARCWGRRQCAEDLSHREALLAPRGQRSQGGGEAAGDRPQRRHPLRPLGRDGPQRGQPHRSPGGTAAQR